MLVKRRQLDESLIAMVTRSTTCAIKIEGWQFEWVLFDFLPCFVSISSCCAKGRLVVKKISLAMARGLIFRPGYVGTHCLELEMTYVAIDKFGWKTCFKDARVDPWLWSNVCFEWQIFILRRKPTKPNQPPWHNLFYNEGLFQCRWKINYCLVAAGRDADTTPSI